MAHSPALASRFVMTQAVSDTSWHWHTALRMLMPLVSAHTPDSGYAHRQPPWVDMTKATPQALDTLLTLRARWRTLPFPNLVLISPQPETLPFFTNAPAAGYLPVVIVSKTAPLLPQMVPHIDMSFVEDGDIVVSLPKLPGFLIPA